MTLRGRHDVDDVDTIEHRVDRSAKTIGWKVVAAGVRPFSLVRFRDPERGPLIEVMPGGEMAPAEVTEADLQDFLHGESAQRALFPPSPPLLTLPGLLTLL